MGAAGPVTAFALDAESRVEVRVAPDIAVSRGVTTEARHGLGRRAGNAFGSRDFFGSVGAQLGPGTGVAGHPPTAEEVGAGGPLVARGADPDPHERVVALARWRR